jgi:hypothetical protein
MTAQKLSLVAAVCVAAVLSGARSAEATLALAVDFDRNTMPTETESGFVSFASDSVVGVSRTYATTEGDVTVTLSVSGGSKGMFNRGQVPDPIVDAGSFTFAELYNDFVFSNDGGTISVDLSGPGIDANQLYQITWYSFSNPTAAVDGELRPDAATGTTGSITPYGHPALAVGVHPTTNDQYAFTGFWQTSGSTLGIDAVATGSPFNRINGFVITAAVPEASAFVFVGALATGAGILQYRQRRTGRSR